MIRLSVKERSVKISVRETKPTLRVQQAVIVGTGGRPYDGPYEVTPTVEGFTLPTAKKVMSEDLTVKRIPIFETSNAAGGETVYIAADLNE